MDYYGLEIESEKEPEIDELKMRVEKLEADVQALKNLFGRVIDANNLKQTL